VDVGGVLLVIGRVDEGRETVKSWLRSFRGPTRFQDLGNILDQGWRRGLGMAHSTSCIALLVARCHETLRRATSKSPFKLYITMGMNIRSCQVKKHLWNFKD
jgi:hypothetical protein